MDLSINNTHKANNVNFKGMKYTYDMKNLPVFQFVAPPNKNNEKVALEIIRFAKNVKPNIKDVISVPFPKDNNILELDEKTTNYIINHSDGIFYRYKVGEKAVTDKSESVSIGNEKFNILRTSKNQGITPKAGSMRHSFVDADVSPKYLDILKATTKNPATVEAPQTDLDFVHNHFNKLGGSIQGIDYLLTKTDELDPYRYIISTPDIGIDPTSSHKYWPNNLYQCANEQAFKDLNFHLFERGKGYVADGAFTSQSLQSPLVQHVYKWGEASPWYGMLKIEENINPGILPDDEKAMKNIGVKIINDPNNKNHYRKDEPTYIQFFDDRLVSNEAKTSDALIKQTDKSPKDNYDITSNDDSAYMFSFEVSPSDTRHLSVFKKAGSNNVMLKDIKNLDDFLTFENFKITQRHSASNATFWDGNRDIVKMNLSNSADKKAMQEARNYIYGAATFWTEKVQSDLILRTAKATPEEKVKIAKNNGIENFEQLKESLNKATFPVLTQKKSVGNYIENFPLQSIETSPELSAIFAQPDFNEKLLHTKDFASRLEKAVNETIDAAIPSKYKNDSEYKQYVVKTYANDIVKALLQTALDEKTILKDGTTDYTRLGKVTLKSIEKYEPSTPEDEANQVISKIQNGFKPGAVAPVGQQIKKDLEKISLDDFKLAEAITLQGKGGLNWRFDAAKDIGDLDAVRAGEKHFKDVWPDVENFWSDFIGNIRQYNPASYIVCEITDLWSFYNGNNSGFDSRIAKGSHQDAFGKNIDPKLVETEFLSKVGATTSSNYSNYFNKLSCFVGTNPENITDGDNNPVSRAGDLKSLSNCISNFYSVNQPDNINLSHTFVENHDKPRIMHTLPLNLNLFYSEKIQGNEDLERLTKELTGSTEFSQISPKAVAVAQMMDDEIEKSYTGKEKQALKQALRELAAGKKDEDSKANFKRSEKFGVTPYEISIRDLFKKAGLTENLDVSVLDFHSSMLSKAMKQQTALWEAMNAMPATPTLFNGAEFVQSGYETSSKNVFQANRNPILHYLKTDERYKSYYEKMQAISGLYKLKGLSSIRNGAKITYDVIPDIKPPKDCDDDYIMGKIAHTKDGYKKAMNFINKPSTKATIDEMKDTFGIWGDEGNYSRFMKCCKSGNLEEGIKTYLHNEVNLQMLPIYSYDEKGSQVLQLITNYNTPKKELAYKAKLDTPKQVSPIKMEKCPFEDGTILQRKVYKKGKAFSDEAVLNSDSIAQKYIVKNGTIYPANKKGSSYVADENKKINVDDTVLTFYKV